jgi:hypothetical protein
MHQQKTNFGTVHIVLSYVVNTKFHFRIISRTLKYFVIKLPATLAVLQPTLSRE